jgi:phenylalanyl-tRNA synthetase alpha chain
MLRKGIDDIRLLRSEDSRVAAQLLDLSPYRPVSRQPATERDMSIAVAADEPAELLGDRVRSALGSTANDIESVSVLSETPYCELPDVARVRLGIASHQKNLLLRVILRRLERALTHAEESAAQRDYAALHQVGSVNGPKTRRAPSRCKIFERR